MCAILPLPETYILGEEEEGVRKIWRSRCRATGILSLFFTAPSTTQQW